MSRKAFIESHGASCANWTWSWSFVNHDEKFVIFGAWDTNTKNNRTEIFSKSWEYGADRKKSGFKQSLQHIRLIEEEEYSLFTFPIIMAKDGEGGSAKIERLIKVLSQKNLLRVQNRWYATDGPPEWPAESESETFLEGSTRTVIVNAYERDPVARKKCLQYYKPICQVCAFNFSANFGRLGADFMHVHHLVPLSSIRRAYRVDPIKDLRPVCPNCHAMLHKKKDVLSIEELKAIRTAALVNTRSKQTTT